jgi:hypothetical protein
MIELNYRQELQDQMMVHHVYRSYWKRIKPTLSFWLCLFLILAGFTYYRATVNFIFAHHTQLKQSSLNISAHQIFTTIHPKS